MYDRLGTTLGSQSIAPSAAPVTHPNSTAIIPLVVVQVVRSVTEALMPASGASSAANMEPQQQDSGKGKQYDTYGLSVVKDFSGVDAINEIQRIFICSRLRRTWIIRNSSIRTTM